LLESLTTLLALQHLSKPLQRRGIYLITLVTSILTIITLYWQEDQGVKKRNNSRKLPITYFGKYTCSPATFWCSITRGYWLQNELV